MALTEEQLIEAGLRTGLLTGTEIEPLRLEARRQRTSLLSVAQARFRLPSTALYRAVAETRGIPFVNLAHCQPNQELIKKAPTSLLRRKLLLPVVNGHDNASVLAVSDPNDRISIESVQRLLGQPLPVVMSDREALKVEVERALQRTPGHKTTTETKNHEADLVALLDDILREAYFSSASDVHLLTEKGGLRVRLRIDGHLQDYPLSADAGVAAGLASRVKVLAGLDISEQRHPQDGGFTYPYPPPINRDINIRVATAPARLAERITLRLLDQESAGMTLTDLGIQSSDLTQFRNAIRQPYGMILLTGPTGSGKSTTLFAALEEINDPAVNIMTVENPIEYTMDGISQMQTGPKLNFADALRSLLRHDPDVLMVGEIRDRETADVAVKAAMTGHLVFSTLHTNNAISAITRLINIGCEPFLIGSTMTAVIAQRLVRRLCQNCRKPRSATEAEATELGRPDQTVEICEAGGCAACQGSGYRGRIGLFETLWLNERLGRMITSGANEEELEQAATSQLKFLWEDGCEKVLAGLTSLDELRCVAMRKTCAMPGDP